MKRFVACLLSSLVLTDAIAATGDAKSSMVLALDAYIVAHAANGDFSGVVLVTRSGQRMYEKSAGLASRRFDIKVGPDTRFLIASVTKTLTAAGLALLQKQEKLKIEDSLDRFLPAFPPAKRIRLWHLLAHQSGLANPDYDAIAGRSLSPDQLLAAIAARPALFEAGTQTRYSNAGYNVLARVIDSASGKPYGTFLRDAIFTPLAMTGSGTLRSGEIVPRLAEGYVPDAGNGFRAAAPRDPSSLYGSGNVYSTAGDLDRWLTAIDRHELFDLTQQPYPFGWGKREWFEKQVFVQSGFVDGYSSIILTVAADELHIVVLMNTQSGFTADEGKSLLGAVLGQPLPAPQRRAAPPPIAKARLGEYAGDYLWGDAKIPMHLETDGETLTLRWADSPTGVPVTPLSQTEFFDRSSFGRIRFQDHGLVWTQNGEDTSALRAK